LKLFVKRKRMKRNMSTIFLPTMQQSLKNLKFLLVFVFFTLTKLAFSQAIFFNPITGTNPSDSNPFTSGQIFSNGISVSGIGVGGGIAAAGASNRYNTEDWTSASSPNPNDFIVWTITPNSCYEVDFTSLVFEFQRSGNGPQNIALRSSLDGYASNIWSLSNLSVNVQTVTIPLSATVFQDLTSAITFRLYGWNASNDGGSFSINSFQFNGQVNALVPPLAGTITGESPICSGSSTVLSLSSYTGSVQWQSSTNNNTFTNISGATSATYATPVLNSTTDYRAVFTLGTCTSIFSNTFTVVTTAPSYSAVNGSGCSGSSVSLGVNSECIPDGVTTNWYSSPAGGVSLGTGNTFTTPILNSTATFYVGMNSISGETSFGDSDRDNEDTGLIFNATSPMLLNSVQVESDASGTITVQLFNSLGNTITGFPAIVFPVVNGINTLNLNWNIPVGTNYQILVTDMSNGVDLTFTEDYDWPVSLGFFGAIIEEIGSGDHYNYFYNWNISTPRIPVVATITPSTNNTTIISICDSYTWSVNGTTYTSSGTYTFVDGCQTETLELTITPSASNTTIVNSCSTYTWPENGTTYITSGTYTFVSGCQTEILELTISAVANNTTTASACDSYTWSVNGTTYTSSGTYTFVDGCQTETLQLTITPSTSNSTFAIACDTYTWSVNGNVYTTSGTYTAVVGCSTETLILTVTASMVYYLDTDGDGFGSAATANFCSAPSTGYSLSNTDCDDAVSTIYPGALELCNDVDDNCSGFIDEGCPSTIAGEEPFNAFLAPTSMYSYCNAFYGTLEGAHPSEHALSSCVTGEDIWYHFYAQTNGVTIFIGSNVNDIVIELQDAEGNLVEIENSVNGPGTEVLTTTQLTIGELYRVAVRNNNSILNPGGQYSACVRHLRRGGSDSGTSATWPGTLSTCSLFKAAYCGGTGVQYRYTWTGISGTAVGQVFTRTQVSDYLNVTAVTPSLHAGSIYNVLVTAIYTIPNGAGVNEVVELPALAPSAITISPVANVALRTSDQSSNGPRYRGSIVASLPWVCGVTNWRWRFTEVNPLTLQTVGLPIEQNRGAASNYINLNNVTALQYGKTYAVQTAPIFSYTGTNYQWGPVRYMSIIGSAGLIVDPTEGAAQGSEKDVLQGPSEGVTQEMELSVFPNPSNGSDLNLSVSGIESDNVQVKVYDALGRKIESKRFVVDGTLQTTLNLANELSNGLYILEVTTEDVKRSVRFMVEQ